MPSPSPLNSRLDDNDFVINSNQHGAEACQQPRATVGREPHDAQRSQRRAIIQDRLALLRSTLQHPHGLQPVRHVAGVRDMRSEAEVCSPRGGAEQRHQGGEPSDRTAGYGDSPGRPQGPEAGPRDREGGHRDGVCKVSLRAALAPQGCDSEGKEHGGTTSRSEAIGCGDSGDDFRLRRPREPQCSRDGGWSGRQGDSQGEQLIPIRSKLGSGDTPSRVTMKPRASEMPRRVARGILAMASMLVAVGHRELQACLVESMQVAAWEIGALPQSMLATACHHEGLRCQRINHANGFDLYKKETFGNLRRLFQEQRPLRIWFAPRCDRWSPEEFLHDGSILMKENTANKRRTERTMLRRMCDFLLWCMDMSPTTEIHWEWPSDSVGWKDVIMKEFSTRLWERNKEWLTCRIDGCRYGLERPGAYQPKEFLHKKWMVKTTCPVFHSIFKTKVCVQDHRHAPPFILQESPRIDFPWRLASAIARSWRERLLPGKWMKMLWAPVDQSMTDAEFHQIVLHGNSDRASRARLVRRDGCEGQGKFFLEGASDLIDIMPVSIDAAEADLEEEEQAVEDSYPQVPEPTEDDKKEWERKLRRFHNAAGHPSNRNLARLVKDAGKSKWQVEMAMNYDCPHCKALRPGGPSSKQIPPLSTRPAPVGLKWWLMLGISLVFLTVASLSLSCSWMQPHALGWRNP